MKLPAILAQRLHWINFPGAVLIALLQRTPVLNLIVITDEMVLSSPIGVVLKSTVAAVAALGAVNSLAGATPLVPSSGTATGVTVAAGTPVSIFYTVNGTQTPAMSWSVSGSIPPGLDFSGLTSPGVANVTILQLEGTPTTAGTYDVSLSVYSALGATGFSLGPYPYTITVTGSGSGASAPSITTQPASQTMTAGSSVTFTVAASGSPAPTYQWRKDGTNISGATSTSFTIASVAASDAGTYTAVATNSAGSATSNGATLTVNAAAAAPNFTTQPASQTMTAGSSVTFTVAASGSPTPTYQWRKDGTNIAGVTTASYTIASVSAGDAGTYTAVASNSAGSATSNGATLTVNPAAPSAPAFLTQPASATVAVGQQASFTVAAAGNPPPSYQWQRMPAGSAAWETVKEGGSYHGVAGTTLTVNPATAAMSGDQFRCLATNPSGTATSTAGMLSVPNASTALLEYPAAIAEDGSGNLYVADAFNNTIEKITAVGVVSMLAGSAGVAGSQDGNGASAMFNQPGGLAVDGTGTVYVADTGNATIRKVSASGTVTTVAGSPSSRGSRDGAGSSAQFNQPSGLALDTAGNLYVADAFNATIRKVSSDGVVSTLAGTAGSRGDADGTGASAQFNFPSGVAVDAAGNVYVADTYNETIRKVTAAGTVTTLAGSAGISGGNDGAGVDALFNQPYGVSVDAAGNVYVADTGNGAIRKLTPGGAVTTLAGVAGVAGMGDGAGAAALFNQPHGVVVDGGGTLWVADTGNAAVRKVNADNSVTTLALTAASSGTTPPPTGGGTPPPAMMSGSASGGGGGALESWFVITLALLGVTRWQARKTYARSASKQRDT